MMDGFQQQQLIVGPGFMNQATVQPSGQKSLSEALMRMGIGQSYAGDGFAGTGPRPTRSYSQVAAVFGCVKAKSDAMGSLPLMISTADDHVLESGPLVDLAERPNEKMTGRQFRRHTSAYLDLFGRAHWWLRLDAGGRPVEVVPVNPIQMTPKRNPRTGELLAWKYRPAGRFSSLELTLSLDEVHTIVDPDFEGHDPLEGLSPRKAASGAIAQYWKADIANESSLDNGLEPGGVFEAPGNLVGDQLDDLRDQVDAKHRGVVNRRRYLVLHGGLQWKPTASTFSDMEFPELKKMSRADICAAFNVPPSVVGFFEDSNYAHAESAEQAFWIKTILPMAARLAEEWDRAVLDPFVGDRSLAMEDAVRRKATQIERTGLTYRRAAKAARRGRGRRFYAWFDASDVPAVQAARLATAEQATKWNQIGVPLNQILAATDAPFEAVPWGDTWHKPIGLVDVQEEAGLPGSDDPSGAGETDLLEEPGEGDRGGRRRQRGSGERVELDIPEKTRARLHGQWRASWSGLERATRGKLRKHFNQARNETLKRIAATLPKIESLRKAGPLDGTVRRDLLGQMLFDLVEANERMRVRVGPLIREAYRLGGEQSVQEAAEAQGKPAEDADPFNIDDPAVAEKLRQRTLEIVNLNRHQQRRLRQTLEEGLDAGEGMEKLIERVKTRFNQVDKRAATIARTEVGAAVEESKAEGRRQAGVPLKSWLSSRKIDTGRPSHAATEVKTFAEPVPQDEDFVIEGTGIRCRHPRDASLSAAHSVNCTCTVIPRFPGDSIRSVIARYQQRGFLSYEQMVARDRKGGAQ